MAEHQRIVFMTRGAKVGLITSWIMMAALFVWLMVTSATVANLNKTDSIACQFLNADAIIRQKQANNTKETTLESEKKYLRDADAFISLFKSAEKTSKTPGSLKLFEAYVRAERQLVASLRDGTLQNVVLTQTLADAGQRLANQLHC